MERWTINNRYHVIRELGRGGMGRVYLVKDGRLENRLLALKMLRHELATREFIDRFHVEFGELARLRHPNLAAAYDFGRVARTGEHFFTTAYIEGVNLLAGTAGSSVDQVVEILRQLLRGLDFIHSHGLLHNDLKPSNILLESREAGKAERDRIAELEDAVFGGDTVKIIDFGLLSAEHVAWSKIKGTRSYISPERMGCLPADRRSDLYSLGVVLYQMLARLLPFQARGPLPQSAGDQAPSLAEHRPDLPPPLVQLVDRLLQTEPDDRFPSAAEALRFLEAALGGREEPVATRSRVPRLACGNLLRREDELAFLLECLQNVSRLTADSCCVVIQGPAGVGKTRLVQELRSNVQLCGGAFISVDADAVEGHLLRVADRVLAGLETCGVVGLEELRRALQLRASDVSEFSTILEQVLIEQATRMPLLLHFDDFQNASETVRHFVLELIQAFGDEPEEGNFPPRLLVVISRRLEEGRGDLRLSGVLTLDLKPFSTETSREFLKKVFGQEEIPEEILETLARVSGGNPCLLVELAQDLVDQGHIRYQGSRWEFPVSLVGIPLPESIASFLAKKVQELDTDSRTLLEWLALAHAPLSPGVLRRGSGLPDRRLKQLLERMIDRGIVCTDPQGHYSLQHQGVRTTLAAGIAAERGISMHQRLAHAMEMELGEEGAQSGLGCVILAHHWLEADNVPGFLRYAPRAASSLQRCGNFELAVDYHRRIVNEMPDEATAKKVQSLARLSEMHEFLWDLDQARRDLETILTLGGRLLSAPDRCSLLRRIAVIEIARNRNSLALDTLAQARALLGGGADRLSFLALDAPEAWAAWFAGDRPRSRAAQERAEQALAGPLASGGARSALVISARNLLANLHYQRGDLATAAENYQLNLEVLDGSASIQAEAATRCSYGSLLLDLGRIGEAREHLSRSLETAKRIGDRRTLSRARERLGEYHRLHGDLKRALQIAEVALQDAEAIDHSTAIASSLCMLGRLHLRAGQVRSAAEAFGRALLFYRACEDPSGTPAALLDLARLFIAEGNWAEARQVAAQGEYEADRHGLVLVRASARLLQAEIELAGSRVLDAEAVEKAESDFRAAGCIVGEIESGLFFARAAIQCGSPARCAARLSRIEGLLEAAGSREQVARVMFLKAILEAHLGRTSQAIQNLRGLEQIAINSVLPQIAADCKQALQELSAGTRDPGPRIWTATTVLDR